MEELITNEAEGTAPVTLSFDLTLPQKSPKLGTSWPGKGPNA